MITCFYGKLGSGKTTALVRYALDNLNAGRIVSTNFWLSWNGRPPRRLGPLSRVAIPPGNHTRFGTVDDFLQLRDAVACLDEGWLYFSSSRVREMTVEQTMKLLESRKDGLDIAYTTQRPSLVNVNLREMTNRFVCCEVGYSRFLRRQIFYTYEADLTSSGVKILTDTKWVERKTRNGSSQWILEEVPQKPQVFIFNSKIQSMYDTTQKIGNVIDGKLVLGGQDDFVVEPDLSETDLTLEQLDTVPAHEVHKIVVQHL